jgi:RNA polymerase sigma-70 factor (ECF subfamily)
MSAPVSLGIDTVQENIRINIDPTFRATRIVCMIEPEAFALSPSRRPCKIPRGHQADRERERTRVPKPPQPAFSDQTILMLAVRDKRDRAAFEQLFDYFAPRLKGVAMRSGLSSSAAEDVAQEVMLSVWRKADKFDPHRAPVAAWVFQIARNRRIDMVRKENRPLPEEIKMADDVEGDASQILALEQEARQLRIALGQMKADQRDMIEKAYLGELTHKEISAQTGLALGTVKSRIRLGLERLRHDLKGMR